MPRECIQAQKEQRVNKKSAVEPITVIGLICFFVFGGLGIMGFMDKESDMMVVLFNLLIAMVSLFVALNPLIKKRRK